MARNDSNKTHLFISASPACSGAALKSIRRKVQNDDGETGKRRRSIWKDGEKTNWRVAAEWLHATRQRIFLFFFFSQSSAEESTIWWQSKNIVRVEFSGFKQNYQNAKFKTRYSLYTSVRKGSDSVVPTWRSSTCERTQTLWLPFYICDIHLFDRIWFLPSIVNNTFTPLFASQCLHLIANDSMQPHSWGLCALLCYKQYLWIASSNLTWP